MATPAAALAAREVADVQAAIRVARDHGVSLSIRGGGHSGGAFAAASDGLMLDLSGLRSVYVDPAHRRARAEPGATWGVYDAATQRHGLASTGGIVSSTGVVGLTLGGGIGALRGLHGLAVDNLRAAEIVLADGSVARVDAGHDPDLFWALRGGGGNFGVVIGVEFSVHPVTELTTGLLAWPLDGAHTIAEAYRSLAAELPDHAVADLVFTHDDSGSPTILVIPRIVGGIPGTPPLIETLRKTRTPTVDTVTDRTYVDSQSFLDPSAHWGKRVYWDTVTLRHLDERVVEILSSYTRAAPSRASAINVEHFHGAVSRVDGASTAVGFRHAVYNVFVEAKWDEHGADAENRTWVRELVQALEPYSPGGAYVNYLPRDADQERVRSAYGAETYDRLQTIKNSYDPGNLFHTNQNIPPSRSTNS
jgi:FAD/FMN-containing dehydrogenase